MFGKANKLPQWLRLMLAVAIVLGICFRVVNVDRKVYWHDEVHTSIRIAGYTLNEIQQEIQDNNIISAKDLQKYQFPNDRKSLQDTVSSLAIDEPQLSPLYFAVLRLWVNLFGNSIAVIRSLSVVLGLLIFPCIYWLCLELFKSAAIGWIAMALVSVSPLHILYAQEARMYSLHTLNILLSSVALLIAIRKETKLGWLAYAATISLGLYTHPLFCFVLAVHGLYVIINSRLKLKPTLVSYVSASVLGILSFVPWIVIVLTRFRQVNNNLNWLNEAPSIPKIAAFWIINYTKIFFDFKADYQFGKSLPHLLAFAVFGLAALGLLGYSLYYFYRNSPKKKYYFVLLLLFIPALLLAVPDLLLGGSRSIHLRYAIPTYLGCQLAFAYVFSQKIGGADRSLVQQKTIWSGILSCVLLIGIVSYSFSYQNAAWWNKYFNADNIAISQLLNPEKSSLIICYQCTQGMEFGNIVSLSYHLSDRSKIYMQQQLDITQIPDNIETVFLFNPSLALQEEINNRTDLDLENIYQNNLSLWKIRN